MEKPKVVRCADGHFRRAILSLGPYIADYPEQVWLSGVVSNWCPKCVLNWVLPPVLHRSGLDVMPCQQISMALAVIDAHMRRQTFLSVLSIQEFCGMILEFGTISWFVFSFVGLFVDY